jgi:hypothetical protein
VFGRHVWFGDVTLEEYDAGFDPTDEAELDAIGGSFEDFEVVVGEFGG